MPLVCFPRLESCLHAIRNDNLPLNRAEAIANPNRFRCRGYCHEALGMNILSALLANSETPFRYAVNSSVGLRSCCNSRLRFGNRDCVGMPAEVHQSDSRTARMPADRWLQVCDALLQDAVKNDRLTIISRWVYHARRFAIEMPSAAACMRPTKRGRYYGT